MLVYCHSMQCKITENMKDFSSLGYCKFYRDNILKEIQKKLRLKKFLSFVYPSWFVNVKSKYRKEVNHDGFTWLKKLARLSPGAFEGKYHPGIRFYLQTTSGSPNESIHYTHSFRIIQMVGSCLSDIYIHICSGDSANVPAGNV